MPAFHQIAVPAGSMPFFPALGVNPLNEAFRQQQQQHVLQTAAAVAGFPMVNQPVTSLNLGVAAAGLFTAGSRVIRAVDPYQAQTMQHTIPLKRCV